MEGITMLSISAVNCDNQEDPQLPILLYFCQEVLCSYACLSMVASTCLFAVNISYTL